ncbi:MAG: lactate utilization protein [Erysipelotrichaceae bacterium]
MDQNKKTIIELQVAKARKKLLEHQMNSYYCETKDELMTLLDTLVKDHSVVSHGGSETLKETGVIDYLRSRDLEFYDRDKKNQDKDYKQLCLQKGFIADAYFMSSSAVTLNGELYNVDGNGNRLAAMMYGPKEVFVIVGTNKIVKDLMEAQNRMKRISAPMNCVRLNRKTPCAISGICQDCRSNDRVCSHTVISDWQTSNRIKVIFVLGDFGY